MEFSKPLVKGKLIKRYKRFFTDVQFDKKILTSHCPNTGSMNVLLFDGIVVYLLPINYPKSKLKYGLYIFKSRKNLFVFITHFSIKFAHLSLNYILIK